MENLVVTLETAKKLEATGFPQDTVFCWDESDRADAYFANVELMEQGVFKVIAAPTAQEIADQLPEEWTMFNEGGKIRAQSGDHFPKSSVADTMAEALALLWLKLQEAK